jgi:photosynthetic reaction center cytochrome c subunit
MSLVNLFRAHALPSLAALSALVLLVGCERPPITAVQSGYRGLGMEQVNNPRTDAKTVAANQAPASPDAASADGPKAAEVYKNVKVLGHLSVAEFTRHMASITAWVAPKEGCTYCHDAQNFADDAKYTKVVARRMVQMTQHLNADWKPHVGDTGVTCYTCHRGNPVPAQVWTKPADRKYAANSVMGDLAGQNLASKSVGYSSLPFDPFTPYLEQDQAIRVNGDKALKVNGAGANRASTKQAEHTYGLMVHMSESLGVNCTFCHNTRNFQSWSEAPPQRVTAYHGIRMARDLNKDYLVPLTSTFPANRLGPKGDVQKVNCGTCHQGVNKPLLGAAMAKNHPELLSAHVQPTPAAVPVSEAVVTPVATAPAPVVEAVRAVLYFGVGSAALAKDQGGALAPVIKGLAANPSAKASISGYHSAAGSLASNQDLAKRRAFAVRDSLQAAGFGADRVVLEKPQSAEANPSGEDRNARRVEVTVQ